MDPSDDFQYDIRDTCPVCWLPYTTIESDHDVQLQPTCGPVHVARVKVQLVSCSHALCAPCLARMQALAVPSLPFLMHCPLCRAAIKDPGGKRPSLLDRLRRVVKNAMPGTNPREGSWSGGAQPQGTRAGSGPSPASSSSSEFARPHVSEQAAPGPSDDRDHERHVGLGLGDVCWTGLTLWGLAGAAPMGLAFPADFSMTLSLGSAQLQGGAAGGSAMHDDRDVRSSRGRGHAESAAAGSSS